MRRRRRDGFTLTDCLRRLAELIRLVVGVDPTEEVGDDLHVRRVLLQRALVEEWYLQFQQLVAVLTHLPLREDLRQLLQDEECLILYQVIIGLLWEVIACNEHELQHFIHSICDQLVLRHVFRHDISNGLLRRVELIREQLEEDKHSIRIGDELNEMGELPDAVMFEFLREEQQARGDHIRSDEAMACDLNPDDGGHHGS